MLVSDEKTQDLRVRRTRLLLRNAFMELMTEKNFRSITVQDIADRAMVNRTTFYDHFVDKYALLEYAISEQFKQPLHSTVPEDSQFSPENLRLLLITTCEFLSQLRNHCLPKDREILPLVQTQITRLIAEILTSWIDDALPHNARSMSRAPLIATITGWAIYGAGLYWSQANEQESLSEFVSQALPAITASFGQAINARVS